MDRKWLPLNALRAFEAAGQHLSFTAAANSLTVAQSAVSRHVIVLENFLGVALFERRPQQLVLTEAGRHILPVVSKSFDRIDQALGEVIKEKGRPKRVLKVALPTSFAHRLAIPILRDFRSENAGISLEICAAFPAITAVGKGFDAYVAVDASGTFSKTKREVGLLRMLQAGVIVSDYTSLMVEILKDNARPEAATVYGAIDMPWAKLVGQIAQAKGK